jgi:hypothetical protein
MSTVSNEAGASHAVTASIVIDRLKKHYGVEDPKTVFEKAFVGDNAKDPLSRDEASFIERQYAAFNESGEVPCYVTRAFEALS